MALVLAVPASGGAIPVATAGPVPCELGSRLGPLVDARLAGAAVRSDLHLALAAGPAAMRMSLKDARGATLFEREVELQGSSCPSLESSLSLLASFWIRSAPPAPVRPHPLKPHLAPPDAGADADPSAATPPDDAGPSPDAGEPDAGDLDAGAPDAGAPEVLDAGAPAAPDAGPPQPAVRPVIPTAPPLAAPAPLFGDVGLGAGVYAATSLGANGLWIPTWFGGEAELVLPSWRLRALAAQARTLRRSAGAGTLSDSDLFGGVRAELPVGSLGFAVEGGLRLDRLAISTSGFAVNHQPTLWDPGLDVAGRWRHGVGPACWVDLGALGTARAHQRVLQVEGEGPVLTVPALWLSLEVLGGCRIF